ncbi:glucosamine-6-phosphate deaminase [[Clostridium] hylemonae]|uniref:Glucosamine-6-phosphate deaminase n=1 Tax=[Clostridium] hylemonae DSM 15053 TaxID=553973 RepID=C0C0L2_9FIRM|nr:glucosamine-6-phosphate deaminase [[Clostridium] hylemonae]EEG74349.1 glucosamine-6-phosphate deaminase [[Clostridium] hylemonae DSM 15053]
MKVIVVDDYGQMSQWAAQIIAEQVREKPESVLGLATGSTPAGMYEQLVRMYEEGKVDFSGVRTANLDEYAGLSGSHPQSFRYFMDTHFFGQVNIKKDNIHFPKSTEGDFGAIAEEYEAQLRRLGSADIQVLGIGGNGHIGFNEPSDHFTEAVNVAELTGETIRANARFFTSPEEVPREAVTMGIKNVMSAKKIILLANGSGKRDIIRKMVYGDITPALPASILRLHGDCTVIVDKEAGQDLKEVE